MSLEIYLNHYSNSPLKSVIKAIDESAKKSFEEASPIPAAANHSVEFYNHEQEQIFNQEWICIARIDEVPNTGDFLTHDIAGTLLW